MKLGDYVNRNGRHRHTQYIISNSEILGYTPEQRQIICAIARYLGKSRPTPGDAALKGLLPLEQEQIAKAVHAVAPGACHEPEPQSRSSASAHWHSRRRGPGDVDVAQESGVDLELWAIERDRDYFREAFWTRAFRGGLRRGYVASLGVRHQESHPELRRSLHLRHRSFAQFQRGLAAGGTDDSSQKFAQVRVMSHHHDGFMAGIFIEYFTELCKGRLGAQRRVGQDLAFEPHLVSDQRCRLGCALERAGENHIRLHIQRGQRAAYIAALLDALLVEAALLVFLGIEAMGSPAFACRKK